LKEVAHAGVQLARVPDGDPQLVEQLVLAV